MQIGKDGTEGFLVKRVVKAHTLDQVMRLFDSIFDLY